MHLRLGRASQEDGFTMIATIGAIALVTLLAGAALAATNGDLGLVRRDLDDKRAYAAAQAGISDYVFHLTNDTGYWTRCTNVPTPNAINQVGSTTQRRTVPGSTDGSQYAIELLPATGQSACNPNNAVGSMLESSGPNIGTFRIRSTGYAGRPSSRSSRPSSRPPSSTTSTSPSSRPRIRSPTGSGIRLRP